jgi:nicotinate-nucleotide pyrophosphorylase (carboxylating)
MDNFLEQEIKRTACLAFEEDQVKNDITSRACLPFAKEISAHIILKQDALLAGLIFLPWIFSQLDSSVKIDLLVKDGQSCKKGTVLASLKGSALSILCGERSALNMVQHASGIATMTQAFVEAVKGYACDILDTRKTLPGLRALQKYAVRTGGGKNHRFHLADRILIKNNHLSLMQKQSPRPVFDAILKAKEMSPTAKIEVEVEDLKMLNDALEAKADLILLDNMDAATVKEAVKIAGGRAYMEASGGMTLPKVKEFAAAGVDGISIGALTHSVSAIDMSLRVGK